VADVNANIGVNIDTSNALAQLKALQRQISQFHSSIAKSSETAALAQRDLQRNFLNGVNAIGAFSAELRTVKTSAESFTDALEKNKFSMREYFRYAGASTKTFGKLFTSEFDTINKVAEENVKRLQTQYIKMGRDANGAMRAIAIMPNELDMSNMSTQLQMTAQRQALFNQLVKQGSTNLLNFGKNTQWAGRQLMVGFTLPLATLGTTAARTFMEMEAAALKFRKVYGDLFTPREETQQALADVTALGQMFTKYGVAVSDTVGLAAEAAAAGFQGLDLQRQTTQATRLSVLGQIDNQKALETTISLQNAFKMSSEDLAGSIDFLNAVENQTVVSLDDITTAIPKVAPVIQQLGGDVKDLAFFMAAMKEGGVNASEGANALKSGLASLINPTEKASKMLEGMGINIKQIIETNKGDLKGTVIAFANALDTLDPLTRARAIEQLFGKFQFARLSTLFDNVTNQTGQAARVLDLAGTSIEDLAALSEQELGMTADSAMNKFRKSVEDLKMTLVPLGQTFLEAVTPIVEFIGGILDKFNNLSSGVKKAIVVLTVAIGAIGPVALMTFGLLANGLANIVKGALVLRQGYLRLTGQSQVLGEQTEFLTVEQQKAAAVAHSLDQSHARLTQTFNAEAGAIRALANEYRSALGALQQFAQRNPGMMMPPKKYNNGVTIVPGSGNKDTVPAMLTPGEAIIPADMTQKYGALINGMIAGNIPGYQNGLGFGGKTYNIPTTSGLTQSAVEGVLSRFSKDVEGITLALEILQQQALELGKDFGKVGADRLKKLFDELGVQRNVPKGQSSSGGYVFAHAQAPGADIVDKAEIERLVGLANSTEEGVGRFLNATLETMNAGEQAAQDLLAAQEQERTAKQALIDATTEADRDAAQAQILASQEAQALAEAIIKTAEKARVYTLSNFGFVLPEGANKGEFSPAQVAEQFTGTNVSRTMAPVYSEYARQLGMTLDEALSSPEIASRMHQDINEFASKISIEIGDATDGFLDDPTFYAAVERARVGLGDAVSNILISAIDEMKKTSTLVTFGGAANRGTTGQRTGLSFSEQGLRQDVNATQAAAYVNVGTDVYRKRGEKVANAMVEGAAVGGGTASPSKKTIPIGEDIARGLEVGMQNRADDVANVGEMVAAGGVRGVSRGARTTTPITPGTDFAVEKTRGGVPMQQVANAAVISEATKKSAEDMVKSAKSFQDRMTNLNRTIMGGTFALGSLSGIASLSSGKLGEFAGVISKLNLAMFALMSVTQMLTQTQFISLATKRAENAGMLVGNIATKKMGFNTSLFSGGIKKLLPNLLNFGKVIARFLGPIGVAVTVFTTAYTIIKLVNAANEKTRQKLEAFSDVLSTTTNQAKFLGEYFNFIPMKGSLEQFGKDLEQVAAKTRTARDQLKESEGFQQAYGQTINQVRGMSAEQAQSALTFKGLELISQGMARDQVQLLIDTIKEEAGKKDLKFNFKDIKFDKAGITGLTNELSTSLAGFQKTYKDGLEKTFKYQATGTGRSAQVALVEALVPNKEAKAALKNASAGIASYSESLNRLVKSGTIDAKQFGEATDAMFASIEKSVPDTNTRLALFSAVMKTIDPELAKVTAGVKNLEQKQLLLKAAIAGVSANLIMNASIAFRTADALNKVAAANLKAFGFKDTSAEQAYNRAKANEAAFNAQNELNKAINDAIALQKKLNDAVNGDGKNGGTGEKSAIDKALEALKNQQQELINTKTAYALLRKEGVETGRAFEIASDPILAAALAAGKVDPSKWKELWDILKNVNKEIVDGKLLEFFDTRTAELDLKKQFSDIVPLLEKIGLDANDIKEILSNPDLARAFIEDLKDGKIDSQQLAKYIAQIPELKKIDIVLGISADDAKEELRRKADELFGFLERAAQREYKPKIINAEKEVESAQAAVDKTQAIIDGYERDIETRQRTVETTLSRPIEAFQEQINDLQRSMEINFERPIEALNNQISSIERTIETSFDRPIAAIQANIEQMQRSIELGFERPIAALQEESSDLANELTLMDKAAEQINEKYDAQEAALKKISTINQQISAQQKQQLSIADALSQGDISAAAKAAQDARAEAAAAASERASGNIDAARKASLETLRTSQGMTRVQVEERQFQISQQVFSLEEQKETVAAQILIKQDQIYALEQARIPYQEQIRIKQDQIYQLQSQQKATQDQIRIIEDQIYVLEEQREANLLSIRDLEDKVYNTKVGQLAEDNKLLDAAKKKLEEVKAELQKRLDNIDAQKDAWEAEKDAEMAAKVAAGEYNDVITATIGLLKDVEQKWKDIQTAAANAAKAMAGGGGGNIVAGGNKVVVTPQTGNKKDEDKPITKEEAVNAIKDATNGSAINAAVNAAVVAGATASEVANAMVGSLIKSGMDTPNALSSARYTGQAIAYQKQLEAQAAADALALQQRRSAAAIKATKIGFESKGGLIPKYFASGGFARGTDKIPAMLSPGEFIVSKYAVNSYGIDRLKAINNGETTADGVYNYSINVNVKSGANPDEIARAVMTQIKQVDSQRIRGQRAS